MIWGYQRRSLHSGRMSAWKCIKSKWEASHNLKNQCHFLRMKTRTNQASSYREESLGKVATLQCLAASEGYTGTYFQISVSCILFQ